MSSSLRSRDANFGYGRRGFYRLAPGREVARDRLTTVSILDDFNDFYDPQIKRANIQAVAADIAIHRVDLRDSAAVNALFHREKFDAIVHLAARAGVRPSIRQPQLYYDTNVSGTLHLLEAARLTGIERFIFASSSSVYGISKTVPFSESLHLTQTISPYAATKIAGEFLCSTYSHLYEMRMVALRFFTVYGARQRPDLAIHQFTKRIHAGEPIDQFGDGTTRRDYTYIDDIIQGVMAALKYEGPLFDHLQSRRERNDPVERLDRGHRKGAGTKGADQPIARATRRHAGDLRGHLEGEETARLQSDHAVERWSAEVRRVVFEDAGQTVSRRDSTLAGLHA